MFGGFSLPYTSDIQENELFFDQVFHVDKNSDLVKRPVVFADKKAVLYFIDGFVKDEIMEKILEFLMKIKKDGMIADIKDTKAFADAFIPYVEVDVTADTQEIITMVLSGAIALLVDGFPEAIIIDARTYPTRSIEEPDSDRVLRGSHDGFVETMVFNTALLRRRIRDPHLIVEIVRVGKKSRTDIAICYLESKADPSFVEKIKTKLNALDVDSLTLGHESLAESLIRQRWYNPFPKVRYTERPDSAAASVYEGKILLMVDNSPSAMILPTSIFDFVQETDDFYFPPFTGTYLRLTRIVIFLLTIFLTPVWYLLIQNPSWIPPWLDFIQVAEPNTIPIIFQLLLVELAIDGLKLASLNTPSPLASSFSVIGGLILGEFAVKAQWLVPEVILYMAFVAIANFTQPSYELGYAFKFIRVFLLIATAVFNLWGFIIGLIICILLTCFNKTVEGKSYLYPLIPFNGKELKKMFIRKRLRGTDE